MVLLMEMETRMVLTRRLGARETGESCVGCGVSHLQDEKTEFPKITQSMNGRGRILNH